MHRIYHLALAKLEVFCNYFHKCLESPQVPSVAVSLLMYLFLTGNNLSAAEIGQLIESGQACETAAMFAFYLGVHSRNSIVCYLATGGLWLAGGVIQRNPKILNMPEFTEGLLGYTDHRPLVEKARIALLPEDAAIEGALRIAIKHLQQQ